MTQLTVGNIAVKMQRAVRLNSKEYGDRVIILIDDLVALRTLSVGGLKEILRAREILCDCFYNNNNDYIEDTINCLMDFAFMERTVRDVK